MLLGKGDAVTLCCKFSKATCIRIYKRRNKSVKLYQPVEGKQKEENRQRTGEKEAQKRKRGKFKAKNKMVKTSPCVSVKIINLTDKIHQGGK